MGQGMTFFPFTLFFPIRDRTANMTELLEKNKFIVTQITTLSSLMMNLSSCVNFDRYKAMSSVEEMDEQAELLAKSRDLYASKAHTPVVSAIRGFHSAIVNGTDLI